MDFLTVWNDEQNNNNEELKNFKKKIINIIEKNNENVDKLKDLLLFLKTCEITDDDYYFNKVIEIIQHDDFVDFDKVNDFFDKIKNIIDIKINWAKTL